MIEGFSLRLYRVLTRLAYILSFLFFPMKLHGLENVPLEGPVILCPNHISLTDPILIASVVRRPISFMGKKELFGARWFGRLLTKLGVFPVARGEKDLGAVRTSLNVLKNGEALGIFAQGTRRKKQKEEPPMNTGVGLIAIRSKAPVVPVYLAPYHIFGRVHIYFGKPMDFSSITHADSAALSGVTEQIRQAIFSQDAPRLPEGK